jgi:hypothetical protein
MRRLILAATLLVAAVVAPTARAQSTSTSTPTSTAAPAGLAVVALAGAADAAWPLAQALYAEPTVRAMGIDEAHARVLCGEPAAPTAAVDLRDLSATIAAVHGDDAPSRALLTEVSRRFAVRGLVVVRVEGTHPSARVFLVAVEAFDTATYEPDEGSPLAWSASVRLLARSFGSAPPVVAAPQLATHSEPSIENSPPPRRHFYESGWFWGAVVAAALGGGAIYLATRDNSGSTIHLELQTPH